MSVSVVVVAYRAHQWLAASLESVREQTDDLVVVDNGSAGEAVSGVARACGARVVRAAANRGLAAGVNRGVAAASGDAVALLNDDAFAPPGWLAGAARVLEDETIAAVGPQLVYATSAAEVVLDDDVHRVAGDTRPLGRRVTSVTVGGLDVLASVSGPGVHALESDGGVRWRWTSGPDPFYVPLAGGAAATDVRVNGDPVDVRRVVDLVNSAGTTISGRGYAADIGDGLPVGPAVDVATDRFGVCGAALVARTDVVRRIGPWWERFFLYYEDVDWCWRAQLAGMRIRYEPAAVVRHVGGASTGGEHGAGIRRLSLRNRVLCLARNAPSAVARAEIGEVLAHPGRFRTSGLWSAVAGNAPAAVAARRRLQRAWVRSPAEVWDAWAAAAAQEPNP